VIPDVIRVPPGTLLHLEPGEWNIIGAPATEATTLRLVSIDPDDPRTREGELEVWVWAHRTPCVFKRQHEDCYGGFVRVSAIEQPGPGRPQPGA
jgi:hypothetical protein